MDDALKNLLWPVGTMLGIAALCIAAAVVSAWIPDHWQRRGWDDAVLIRICHDVPIVRLPDGTAWARFSWARRLPVEDESEVCS
jgi:hypothetical protein